MRTPGTVRTPVSCQVEPVHKTAETVGVDVVEESEARPPGGWVRAAPGERPERLAAERGAAGAEHHHVGEARAVGLGDRPAGVQVVRAFRQAE